MSINTITAPGLLLKYQVAMQSVSRLSEQITLTITREQAGFCNYLVLYVPVGLGTGNIFTKSPSIKSSLPAWSPVGSVGELEATLPLPNDDTHSYQRFILYNQNPGASLDSLPLVVTITGSTNTADWTADFLLFESSKVGAADAFTPKRAMCTVNKEYSLLLYIDSFVASLDTPSGVVPVTTLLSGQPFRLSWASNGRSYQLFQDGKPLLAVADPSTAAYGQTGNAVFYKIEAGVFTDTTFVLQAKSPDETLYASLTVTVSNPTYSPGLEPIVNALKSTIAGIDGNLLRNAFRYKRGTEPPVGNKLKSALAATSDATVRTEFFKYCYSFNSFGRRWNDGEDSPQRFGPIVMQFNDTQLKGLLLGTDSPPLKNALQATSDVTLKNALRETSFPVLLTLLDQPSNDALKIAIQQQDDAALIPVFEDVQLTNSLGQDSAVKIGVAVADAKAKLGLDNKNFAFIPSPDTVRSLRVSNGNLLGNMVFQALTGDNAGLATLNFNGYFSSGERQFNPNKARYRVGVDQRGGADRFFIDTYQSNKPPLPAAFTINANGFVGIGTPSPAFPLDVQASLPSNFAFVYYANVNKQSAVGYTTGAPTRVSIRADGEIVGAQFNSVSDARLKSVSGRSDHAADLGLLRRLHITDYTMRDRVQFGDQSFKKLLGQELEEVFPQAVHQHTSFLPDIYANASQVQRQGEALLLTLPTGLPAAAAAGQRLKLIGPAGEVVATLAEAAEAGNQQLLVAGADSLADSPQEVFVFGLEHADVRSVDYEAVAMLNVSATQALAQQVEELHQQNAVLNEQNQAQSTQLAAMQAALRLLQEQVATFALGNSSLATMPS